MDGGLHHNNPAFIADFEREALWPRDKQGNGYGVDVFVSIGAGYSDNTQDTDTDRLRFNLMDGIREFVWVGEKTLQTWSDCRSR